jgi:hypothetical protein
MRQRAARYAALAAILAVPLVSAGCLVKDTTASLVLEPNGSVTWTVLERNIHATGDTPADRLREEDAFMALVAADQHPNAVAFRALGGLDVRTDVVSSRWPYAVTTEARFSNVAAILQRIFDQFTQLRAQSVIATNGNKTTWKITVDYDPDAEQTEVGDGDGLPLSALSDDVPVIFIRHGQFVDAAGFDISDDGRVAKPTNELENRDWDKDRHMVMSLSWVATEAVNAPKK